MVEILIVVTLIGILIAGTIVVLNPSQQLKRSRDGQRKSDLKLIQSALEQYKSDNGYYPGFVAGQPVKSLGAAKNVIINTTSTNYLNTTPVGPTGASDATCSDYVYSVEANGSNYTLFTTLENATDSDATTAKSVPSSVPSGGTTTDGYKSFYWTLGSCTYNAATKVGKLYNYWVNNP